MSHVLNRRRAGVLCHLASLPQPRLDAADTHRFLDFLERAGLSIWQMLPLNGPDSYGSPFRSDSLFAVDPTFAPNVHTDARVLNLFRAEQADWVEDYALYRTIRTRQGLPWNHWPEPLRTRQSAALAPLSQEHAAVITSHVIRQAAAAAGLERLRSEAHARGVLLFGDLPMYPAHDSAEVWSHPELFQLDEHGNPLAVAGVPPDNFAPAGQLWGNPLYAWEVHQANEFEWWRRRIARQAALFDVLRLDHFRGLDAAWSVANGARVADGHWQPVPGRQLLTHLQEDGLLGQLVAEDLGTMTPSVESLRDGFALPGMRVLQFAFDGDSRNPHLPAHHPEHAVVYTGTHDTNTTLGWLDALDDGTRRCLSDHVDATEQRVWSLIEVAFHSPANTAIIPLQDFLQLGSKHRMNTPGHALGNWSWQLDWDQLDDALAKQIKALVVAAGRF